MSVSGAARRVDAALAGATELAAAALVAMRHWNEAALAQRDDVRHLNETLQGDLEKKGLVFNKPDAAAFRAVLRDAGFYREWREKYGADAWAVLEKYAGGLA